MELGLSFMDSEGFRKQGDASQASGAVSQEKIGSFPFFFPFCFKCWWPTPLPNRVGGGPRWLNRKGKNMPGDSPKPFLLRMDSSGIFWPSSLHFTGPLGHNPWQPKRGAVGVSWGACRAVLCQGGGEGSCRKWAGEVKSTSGGDVGAEFLLKGVGWIKGKGVQPSPHFKKAG